MPFSLKVAGERFGKLYKGAKESYTKYQAEAPARRAAEIDKLRQEGEIERERLKIAKLKKERAGYSTSGSGMLSGSGYFNSSGWFAAKPTTATAATAAKPATTATTKKRKRKVYYSYAPPRRRARRRVYYYTR